jgi:hypothetical protein
MSNNETGHCADLTSPGPELLKPMDLKRLARVPYTTVIKWLTTGHPRAGILASIDLCETGKRHSYRIRPEDWAAFLARLQTTPRARVQPSPQPRPSTMKASKRGMFRYRLTRSFA